MYSKQKILYNKFKEKFKEKFNSYKIIPNPYNQFCERYATLRIDIKIINQNKDTLFIKNCKPAPLSITKPEWLQKIPNTGDGFVISSFTGKINLNIISIENGELIIYLRGIDARDITNKRYDVFIDCKKLIINDSIIFDKTTTICHDKPYIYKKNMIANEEVFVSIEWCPNKYFSH